MNTTDILDLAKSNPKRTGLVVLAVLLIGAAGVGLILPDDNTATNNIETTEPTETPTQTPPPTESEPDNNTSTETNRSIEPPSDPTAVRDVVTYVYPIHDDPYRVTIYVQSNYVCVYDGPDEDDSRKCEVNEQAAYDYLSFVGFYEENSEFDPPANATTD